jgi:hypothetical protein
VKDRNKQNYIAPRLSLREEYITHVLMVASLTMVPLQDFYPKTEI